MPRLLVSVRNAEEARVALESGAQLIDVKEPALGSLGAADPQTIRDVIAAVAGKVPVSAALGELAEWREASVNTLEGLTYAKLGMAGCSRLADWPKLWTKALREFPPGARPVAVVYADWRNVAAPAPEEILVEAAAIGCSAVLVDTYNKSAGHLLDCWSLAAIAEFVTQVQSQGMLAVLAGSLSLELIPRILPLQPDYIAVRGAACRGDRNGPLSGELVQTLASMVGEASLRSTRLTS